MRLDQGARRDDAFDDRERAVGLFGIEDESEQQYAEVEEQNTEQGCSEGSALACLVFADVNRFGYRAAPRADGRVLEVWNKACELGDANGCRGAASRARAGLGVASSATRADELREKAFKADEETGKKEREAYEKWL